MGFNSGFKGLILICSVSLSAEVGIASCDYRGIRLASLPWGF